MLFLGMDDKPSTDLWEVIFKTFVCHGVAFIKNVCIVSDKQGKVMASLFLLLVGTCFLLQLFLCTSC